MIEAATQADGIPSILAYDWSIDVVGSYARRVIAFYAVSRVVDMPIDGEGKVYVEIGVDQTRGDIVTLDTRHESFT